MGRSLRMEYPGAWYHTGRPHKEVPKQKRVMRDITPGKILQQACRVLDCDVERYRTAPRVYGEDKEKRDLVVYFLWETGLLTNEKVGELFGFSYSSVSHIVKTVQARAKKDRKFSEKLNHLNSQFKM